MPAPDEIYKQAIKRLAEDRARFGATNYVKYPGATTVPMSALTQKARNLQELWGGKAAPYSNKINAVANRTPQGLSPENINAILDSLRYGQQRSSAATIGVLGNQFKKSFEPRIDSAVQKNQKDIGRGVAEAGAQIGDISRELANRQGTQDRNFLDVLRRLQEGKQTRRDLLTSNMERFGKQKEVHGTRVIDANKAQFEKETQWPQKRMQMLAEALGQYENATRNSEEHPDVARSEGQRLATAMQAYER